MSSPPVSVVEPPLSATLKRKRGDSTASALEVAPHIHHHDHDHDHVDADAVEEASSEGSFDDDVLEDIADSLAVSNDGNALRLAYSPSEVHHKIRQDGMDSFMAEIFAKTGMDQRALARSIGLHDIESLDDDVHSFLLEQVLIRMLTRRRKLPQYNTIDDAAELLRTSKNITFVTGAGISTSLGIPDFRSKETGFYSKLKDMGFSEPEEVFDIQTFDDDPNIFYSLAGDILPTGKAFTPTHAFIRLVQDKEKLRTNYTQNIDNLEANAGIDTTKLIQCHGSFATASCRKCWHRVPGHEIFDDIRAKKVALCKVCTARIAQEAQQRPPQKKVKQQATTWTDGASEEEEDDDIPVPGVMKPDITFFGEKLPNDFFERFLEQDSHKADLVIVIGTSLKVAPVSEMPNHMPATVPHIYISREPCEHIDFDIQLLGDCDKVVWELARRAGWSLDHELIPKGLKLEVEEYLFSGHQWTVKPVAEAN